MQFEQTVKPLMTYHKTLWFHASLAKSDFEFCDLWKGGEVLSAAGRLLALQTGHSDKWKLTSNHTIPDCSYEPDECDEGELITKEFLCNVRFYRQLFLRQKF